MLISAMDGRGINVQRRWFPWKVKKRDVSGNALEAMDLTDGIEGIVFGLIFAILVVLFGSIIFFGFELVVVLVLLIPILALLRVFWVLPWIVEATHGNELLGVEKVRGWRDSEERIRDIAAAYQRGEDPFLGKRIP
ncbi:hypothetical protein [Nocardioides marmorisolisilvae]|uniref:Uncharacterized protein n=1 Tax=Nocardioides marmorisolisilvae TaxID=1542737 RepID=A0A3N0DUQ0_9ACTN|nr:hypothetical protein [Nocardioides marmorisolisilvae]RNL79133.1 hypothetical protein EFL95_08850 [Nocardioides marmorisolisilvae]